MSSLVLQWNNKVYSDASSNYNIIRGSRSDYIGWLDLHTKKANSKLNVTYHNWLKQNKTITEITASQVLDAQTPQTDYLLYGVKELDGTLLIFSEDADYFAFYGTSKDTPVALRFNLETGKFALLKKISNTALKEDEEIDPTQFNSWTKICY